MPFYLKSDIGVAEEDGGCKQYKLLSLAPGSFLLPFV
jgi:hypothetical protein